MSGLFGYNKLHFYELTCATFSTNTSFVLTVLTVRAPPPPPHAPPPPPLG